MAESYSRLKFIVVDDFPQFRHAVKNMLESFGATDIDLAARGEDALRMMRNHQYDVILCDYNLGTGKNGQQVLEEASYYRLLSQSTSFMMLTAETSSEMVLGALEYQPDDYLTKPFNKEMLKARLDKVLRRSQEFMPVTLAWDRGHHDDALAQCEGLLERKTKYKLHCFKLKAELLMEMKAYPRAEKIYEQVLKARKQSWALMGIGKACFYQENYPRAREAFDALLSMNRSFVAAYDWLARVDEAEGNIESAFDHVKSATRLSPRVIDRQAWLGRLSTESGDVQTAVNAFRTAVRLSKNSSLKRPENYVELASALLKAGNSDADSSNKTSMVKEALQTMVDTRRLFNERPEIKVKTFLVDGDAYLSIGNKDDAKRALERAVELYETVEEEVLDKDDGSKLISGLEQTGQLHLVSRVNNVLEGKRPEDEPVDEGADSEANEAGVSLYQQGKLEEALEAFDKAMELSPNSLAVHLNAAQANLKYIEVKGATKERMDRVRRLLAYIKRTLLKDTSNQRFDKLLRIFESLYNKG
jgi:tetratricopeptide (TPR) repeat protein